MIKNNSELITFIFLFFSVFSFAQEKDDSTVNSAVSIEVEEVIDTLIEKKHSPSKATIYSAILPGFGQAYNKQYWKIPVIYAGFGIITMYAVQNNRNFKDSKHLFSRKLDNPDIISKSLTELNEEKNKYQLRRDIFIFGGFILYIMNIIDANVYAHFYNFDIDENTSLNIAPYFRKDTDFNLKLSLNF